MSLKKVMAWLMLAFAVFYVITQPAEAAAMVQTVASALGDAASGMASFMQSL